MNIPLSLLAQSGGGGSQFMLNPYSQLSCRWSRNADLLLF